MPHHNKNQSVNEVKKNQTFRRRSGVASFCGIMYEIKICALVLLKLTQLKARFSLCSNLEDGGSFDDVVVNYEYNKENREVESGVFFIQLKHAENENSRKYACHESNKELLKYFLSFLSSQRIVEEVDKIFCSNPLSRIYLLYTNSKGNNKNLLLDKNTQNSFLYNITCGGQVYSIIPEKTSACEFIVRNAEEAKHYLHEISYRRYEKLKSDLDILTKKANNAVLLKLKEDIERKPNEAEKIFNYYKNINVEKVMKDFISQTRICFEQINVSNLDKAIEHEIKNVLTITAEETKKVYNNLIKCMKNWWEKENIYLTEGSTLWNDIVKQTQAARFLKNEKELLSFEVKFYEHILSSFSENLENINGVVNILSNGESTTVTCLKVIQALKYCQACKTKKAGPHKFKTEELKTQTLENEDIGVQMLKTKQYIFVKISECYMGNQTLWETWPSNWCHILVVDCENKSTYRNYDWFAQYVHKLIKEHQNSCCILISPQKNCWKQLFSKLSKEVFYKEIKDDSSVSQLDDSSQSKLYKKEVLFQGEIVKMHEFINEESYKTISSDFLSNLIISESLSLCENTKKLQMQNYVSRSLEIPRVKEEIFKANVTNLVLALETWESLPKSNKVKFIKDINSYSAESTEFMCFVLSPGQEESNFKVLYERFENVHWIKQNDKGYEWKKGKGKMDIIHNFLDYTNNYSIDEKAFIESHLESPVIITGEPGMGKSTLLKHLTVLLKRKFPFKWVVSVNLTEHCDFLDRMGETKENINQTIIKILGNSLRINKSDRIVYNKASEHLDTFIVLLDAFDEISPIFRDKVKLIIEFLVESSCLVYVSTRPSDKAYLETELPTISYHITPLTEEMKKEYLYSLWNEHMNDTSKENFETFSENLLHKYSQSLSDLQNTFTTNPLHLKMLAEIFLMKTPSDENVMINQDSMLNIFQIYSEYVKKKCEYFFKEKLKTDILNPFCRRQLQEFTTSFVEGNKILSAAQIFSELKIEKEDIESAKTNVINKYDIKKFGIMSYITDSKIVYVHRSFLEYFSALYLAENYRENEMVVKEDIFKKEFKIVRMFYDLKCAENCALHTAVILNNLEKVKELLNSKQFTLIDIMGRSALHLSAAYNRSDIIRTLLENRRVNVNILDNINCSPMDYAIKSYSWEAMDALLERRDEFNEDLRKTIWAKIEKEKEYSIYMCVEKSLQCLLSLILESFKFNSELQVTARFFHLFHGLDHTTNLYYEETYNPFLIATKSNNLKIVKQLLRAGCDISAKDKNGYTAIHIASSLGYVDLVKFLIEKGIKINCHTKYNKTPLHVACEGGHLNVVKKLVKHKVKINETTLLGETALLTAARCGKVDIVQYLLEQGTDVVKSNCSIEDIILVACKYGHLDVLKFIKMHNTGTNKIHSFGGKCLLSAAASGHMDVVKYLVDQGNDLTESDFCGFNTMFYACKNGDLNIVEFCVEHGVNVNITNNEGDSGLLLAAASGNLDIVKYFVENGADLTHRDKDCNDALLLGCFKGHLNILKYLLEQGMDINTVNKHGHSGLMYAVKFDHFDVAKCLVERGASGTHSDNNGDSIMKCACGYKSNKFVKLLVENGVDVNTVVNSDGETALVHAASYKKADIVKYLVEQGADVNQLDKDGYNIMLRACRYSFSESKTLLDIVQSFLEGGGNINAVDNAGLSGLLLAAKSCSLDIVRYLIEQGADITQTDGDGNNAMLIALQNLGFLFEEKGDLEMVKVFLEKGGNVNALNNDGLSGLLLAAQYHSFDILKYLVEQGADMNQTDSDGNNIMLFACKKNKSLPEKTANFNIVKFFIECGGNVNMLNNNRESGLLLAAKHGYFDIVNYLVEQGADMSRTDEDGNSVLLIACKNGHFDVVKYFVECSGNVNMVNNNRESGLLLATKHGYPDIIKYLVQQGADTTHTDNIADINMLIACTEGNLDTVKIFIENGGNVNIVNKNGITGLLLAASHGKIDIIKYLVEKGADVEQTNENSETIMHLACKSGCLDIVKFFIESGGNINSVDNSKFSGLLRAVFFGHLDIVKYLVEQGANVEGTLSYGANAVIISCTFGHLDIVKFLVESGVNVNTVDKYGCSGLLNAAKYGYFDIVKYLVKHGADTYLTKNVYDENSMLAACKNGHLEIVKFFAECCGTIYTVNDRDSGLLLAAENGHLNVVKYLVEYGADITHTDNFGNNIMIISCVKGYFDIVMFFVESGGNVNIVNDYGRSGLLNAAESGNLDIVKYLVKQGANITQTNKEGNNIMLIACERNCLEIVRFFVETCQNVNTWNIYGESGLLIAAEKGHFDIVKYLVEQGADITHCDKNGNNIMLIACREGYLHIVQIFVEMGGNVNTVNKDGKTGLLLAADNKHHNIVKYLVDHGASVTDL